MGEYLLDHHGVFNAGDHFHDAATFATCLDIDVENALQSLRPGHGCATFGLRLVLRFIGRLGLAASATPGGRHQSAVLAIGGKYTVETGQVYSRFRHQCRQLGNEIQRLKDDVGSAVVAGRLELVSDIP